MFVHCAPARSARPAARVPSRWRENRLAKTLLAACRKKSRGKK
jgi:hypothetical protein